MEVARPALIERHGHVVARSILLQNGVPRARTILAVLALASVLGARATKADNCSEERQADGKPDSALAGVKVLDGALPELTRHLGPPTTTETIPDPTLPGSGERAYRWQRRHQQVVVWTDYGPPNEGGGSEVATAVEVAVATGPPTAAREQLRPARGVGLGSTRSGVVTKYGSRFIEKKTRGGNRLLYCWMNDTFLSFEFDEQDRVTHVHLLRGAE